MTMYASQAKSNSGLPDTLDRVIGHPLAIIRAKSMNSANDVILITSEIT